MLLNIVNFAFVMIADKITKKINPNFILDVLGNVTRRKILSALPEEPM
jgi:hypothetical protein